MDPGVIQKLNTDKIMEEVGEMAGVPRDVLRPQKEVDQTRANQAKQAQAEKQGQAMMAATQGAKNLSQADPQKLSDLAQQFPTIVQAQQQESV
jgi:hypothetical protein